MSTDDRTFTLSQIHQALSEDERQLAALQRRVDARRKMAEAAEELELAERELSADAAAAASAHAQQATPPPASPEPKQTGKRTKVILQSDTSRDWYSREIWEQMVERGWAEPTKDARAAIRVALKRLAERDPDVVRTAEGMTFAYRFVGADSDQLARGSNGHTPTLGWRN
jgi:uncharacterized membrane protein